MDATHAELQAKRITPSPRRDHLHPADKPRNCCGLRKSKALSACDASLHTAWNSEAETQLTRLLTVLGLVYWHEETLFFKKVADEVASAFSGTGLPNESC